MSDGGSAKKLLKKKVKGTPGKKGKSNQQHFVGRFNHFQDKEEAEGMLLT